MPPQVDGGWPDSPPGSPQVALPPTVRVPFITRTHTKRCAHQPPCFKDQVLPSSSHRPENVPAWSDNGYALAHRQAPGGFLSIFEPSNFSLELVVALNDDL